MNAQRLTDERYVANRRALAGERDMLAEIARLREERDRLADLARQQAAYQRGEQSMGVPVWEWEKALAGVSE